MRVKKFADDIYDLRLHEMVEVDYPSMDDGKWEITRVPGGWLYKRVWDLGCDHPQTTTFVPFNNEFMSRTNK